jgi:hypothetical protein
LTRKSSTISVRAPNWVDEAFLWTAGALVVLAVAAAVPPPGAWPAAGVRGSPRESAPPPWRGPMAAPGLPAGPPPLISFVEPVPGYPVVSPFGLRQLPWEGGGRLHKGVDIAAPKDTPVLAAADGVVLRTGIDPGYGRFLEVQDAAGLTTLYGHLDAYAPGLQPGAGLKQGETVGKLGSTGSSTGPHLHFEVHDDQGRPLNPEMFLNRSFAAERDLPLKQALRLPRGMRVAFVSLIPRQREEQLYERLDQELAKEDAAEAEDQAKQEAMQRARVHAEIARSSVQDRVIIARAAPVKSLALPPSLSPPTPSGVPEGLKILPTPAGARVEAAIGPPR